MNFRQLDIQKFDSSGNYILNEDYLISYLYSDGFTERLLSLNVFVDIKYECKIDVSFHHKRNKVDDNRFNVQFQEELPSIIKASIAQLLEEKHILLKHNYAHSFMEDMGNEHFVINHNGKSRNVGIGIITKKLNPENNSERIFFTLHCEIKKWREEIYQILLKS